MSTDTPNRERQGAVKTSEPATNGKPASATSQEETSSRVDGELENDNVVSASPKPAASVEGVGEGLATTDSAQATNGSDSSVTVDKVEDASGTQDGTATSVVETSGSLVDDEMLLLTGPAAVEASREAARAATAPTRPAWLPRIDDRLSRLILSVVLAVLLWFYVVNLENPTQNTQFTGLNVEAQGVGSNLKAILSPDAVDATVQAPQSVLATLGKADIRAYVDLTGMTEGVHIVPVRFTVNNFRASDVSVRFNPASVQAQLEIQATRPMTVEVNALGTPAFGYGQEPAQVTPSTVMVSGSRDAVSRVSRVVVNVDIDGKAGTQQGTKEPVGLDGNSQPISGLTFEPAKVDVVVPIKLLLNYKPVPVRAPLLGQPAPGYQVASISLDPTNVTVCCSPTVLEPLQFLNTEPVPITGTTSTIVTSTNLILPHNVELYPGQPKEITVTVNVEVMETTFQVSVAPTVEGLQDGWGAVVSPNKIDLTLSGTFAQSQDLSPSDIRAIVNAQGKPAGTFQAKPQIIVPQGIKVVTANPDTVTVTLSEPTPVPPTPTDTPSPTPPPSPTKEAVIAPTAVPSRPTPTDTRVTESTPTATSAATATREPTQTGTSTPQASLTGTPTPGATVTPTP